MTYFIETEKNPGEGRNVVLPRSNVRSRVGQTSQSSGEMRSNQNQIGTIKSSYWAGSDETRSQDDDEEEILIL